MVVALREHSLATAPPHMENLFCQVCGEGLHGMEPVTCSGCFTVGHALCLQVAPVGGFAFCAGCHASAVQLYSRHQSAEQVTWWKERMADTMAQWRKRSITATGALGTVGLGIGAASAMAVGGTAALLKGVFTGAQQVVPTESPSSSRVRAYSADVFTRPRLLDEEGKRIGMQQLAAMGGHCMACHDPSNAGHVRPLERGLSPCPPVDPFST